MFVYANVWVVFTRLCVCNMSICASVGTYEWAMEYVGICMNAFVSVGEKEANN